MWDWGIPHQEAFEKAKILTAQKVLLFQPPQMLSPGERTIQQLRRVKCFTPPGCEMQGVSTPPKLVPTDPTGLWACGLSLWSRWAKGTPPGIQLASWFAMSFHCASWESLTDPSCRLTCVVCPPHQHPTAATHVLLSSSDTTSTVFPDTVLLDLPLQVPSLSRHLLFHSCRLMLFITLHFPLLMASDCYCHLHYHLLSLF